MFDPALINLKTASDKKFIRNLSDLEVEALFAQADTIKVRTEKEKQKRGI
jgi:hypothetical protein